MIFCSSWSKIFHRSLFSMASYITSLTLIEDRRSGIWNRTLTAGVTPLQFLISHLILGSATMLIQAIEFIIYSTFIANNGHTLEFLLLVSSLIILLGFSGTLFGLCISVMTDSVLVTTYISLVLTLPLLSLAGEFWKAVLLCFHNSTFFFKGSCGQWKEFQLFFDTSATFSPSHFPREHF